MKSITFPIIFCGLFFSLNKAENDFPISYLCSSCVLYDTDIGDVFDDLDELTVRGPRPEESLRPSQSNLILSRGSSKMTPTWCGV